MKLIVIGLGSMGKRRIRLLQTLPSKDKIVGVDANVERIEEVKKLYGIQVFSSLEEALESDSFEGAFISTSPLSHKDLICQCLEASLHVFTEINLVADGYESNMELAKKKGVTLFLSSTFLFRDEIKQIQSILGNKKVNYTYHVGQYLPDWHPWENYQQFFVGDVRTNGCREIFAIELPWITATFGDIVDISVMKQKISGLSIEYPDSYMVLVKHQSGNMGMLLVDVVSRKAVRELKIIGEEIFLTWKGSPDSLAQYDYEAKSEIKINLCEEVTRVEGYNNTIVEEAYLGEIKSFFNVVSKKENQPYSFEEDLKILHWIDIIEMNNN